MSDIRILVLRRLMVILSFLLGEKTLEAQAPEISADLDCKFQLERKGGWAWYGFHPTVEERKACDQSPYFFRLFYEYRDDHQTNIPHFIRLNTPVKFSSFSSSQQGFPALNGHSGWALAGVRHSLFSTTDFEFAGGLGHSLEGNDRRYWLNKLNIEARWRSLVLSVGRKPIFWGQSMISPLMISYNAIPLDGVQLTTLPVQLGSFLSGWGRFKSEFVWSLMNDNRQPAHDQLLGWRLGWKPSFNLETNVSFLFQFGGEGVPETSVSDFLIEFLGARPSSAESYATGSATNRAAQWDLRWQVSGSPMIAFYTEQHLEDCCGPIADILRYRHSYVFGVSFVSDSWRYHPEIRAEYLKTTNLLNLHGGWPSALSNNSHELGAFIGRDSQVVALDVRLSQVGVFDQWRASVVFQESCRRQNVYGNPAGEPLSSFEGSFERAEKRWGGVLQVAVSSKRAYWPGYDLSLGLGYTFNRSYVGGSNGWNYLARSGLRWQF